MPPGCSIKLRSDLPSLLRADGFLGASKTSGIGLPRKDRFMELRYLGRPLLMNPFVQGESDLQAYWNLVFGNLES